MEIVAALSHEQAEFAALLDGLDEADWDRPSRCPGWTVSDVVLHLAQTNEAAVGSARGRFAEVARSFSGEPEVSGTVDDWAEAVVSKERGEPVAAVRERYDRSVLDFREELAAGDLRGRVTWVAGEFSLATLATTRLAETWIHAGDVAEALGVDLPATDRLRHIARLAWRTLPYAFARAGRNLSGPVAFELEGPGGDAWVFAPEGEPLTFLRGSAAELCLVAGRRADPGDTALRAEGPDAAAVLDLVRTFA